MIHYLDTSDLENEAERLAQAMEQAETFLEKRIIQRKLENIEHQIIWRQNFRFGVGFQG